MSIYDDIMADARIDLKNSQATFEAEYARAADCEKEALVFIARGFSAIGKRAKLSILQHFASKLLEKEVFKLVFISEDQLRYFIEKEFKRKPRWIYFSEILKEHNKGLDRPKNKPKQQRFEEFHDLCLNNTDSVEIRNIKYNLLTKLGN